MNTKFDEWKSNLTLDDAKELIKQSSCLMCPRFINKTCTGYSKLNTKFDEWKSNLTLDDAKELIKQSSCSMCPRFINKTCAGYSKLNRQELNHEISRDICDDRLDIYFKQEAK